MTVSTIEAEEQVGAFTHVPVFPPSHTYLYSRPHIETAIVRVAPGEHIKCSNSNLEHTASSALGRSQIGESTARQQLKILHQLRLKREHEQQGADRNSTGEAGGQRQTVSETEMAELADSGLLPIYLR
jgi:hypothetical protein